MGKVSPEDYVEITQLINRSEWALDFGDEDGYADCFTEDALMESVAHSCKGRQQLKDLIAEVAAFNRGEAPKSVKLWEEFAGTGGYRHEVTNLVIEVDGDTALAKCYIGNIPKKKVHSPIRTAYYYDKLVRLNGEWKIKERRPMLDRDLASDIGMYTQPPVRPAAEADQSDGCRQQ